MRHPAVGLDGREVRLYPLGESMGHVLGFVGRDGLARWRERGFESAFVTLEVLGVSEADARGSEPLYAGGELVGRATGGGYGWRTNMSLALGMVRPDLAEPGTEIEIEILGQRHPATVIPESPFDPKNERLRA